MANILENQNLDRVGYQVVTNAPCGNNPLQLNKERIMSLSTTDGTTPVEADNTVACLLGSRAFCGSYAANCSDHSCGGKILCVDIRWVNGPRHIDIGGWTFAKDSEGC